jgi:prepilin-type N-terminal cleavage/methylation domain-containing protein
MNRRITRKGGFTMVEISIALVLLGLVLANVFMVLYGTTRSYGQKNAVFETEAQVRRTLDRTALALIGANRSTVYTVLPAPFSTSEIHFETNLGVQGGALAWSQPQTIALELGDRNKIVWSETSSENRRVVWSEWARNYLAGEILNGVDDNGNGLIDEKGLSFDLDGNSIVIRVSLEKEDRDGKPITRTMEARVTCRN